MYYGDEVIDDVAKVGIKDKITSTVFQSSRTTVSSVIAVKKVHELNFRTWSCSIKRAHKRLGTHRSACCKGGHAKMRLCVHGDGSRSR